jgi:hypothetical protein
VILNLKTSKSRSKQLGQGMTEYIIVVALVAVAAIGVYIAFGQTVNAQTAGLATELAGGNSAEMRQVAATAANDAATVASTKKTLNSYDNTNNP